MSQIGSTKLKEVHITISGYEYDQLRAVLKERPMLQDVASEVVYSAGEGDGGANNILKADAEKLQTELKLRKMDLYKAKDHIC
ncbi:hypothetical protein HDV00_011545 [Rhizophlyctis rosea]|nr:hypothetical protein HDV00_011545 [Rhizophlyctis rosea]